MNKTHITAAFIAAFTLTAGIEYPTAFYGPAPLQSGYGGAGRAVAVVGLGSRIEVRSYLSPGQTPRWRQGISQFPAVRVYEWHTWAGEVSVYPVDSPFSYPSFPLWLYGTTEDDAIRLQALLPGSAVTVFGLPGAYGPETTILLPIGPMCWGMLEVPETASFEDAIRFSPVRVAQ